MVHRIIAGLLMVAVALPTKMIINRLFELGNMPCGFERVWLHNQGISKKLAGKISWYWDDPAGKVGGGDSLGGMLP